MTKHELRLEPRETAKNEALYKFIHDIRVTVRVVRDVETMCTLLEALCQLEGKDKKVWLLDFQAHRFLGLTCVLERTIDKWEHIEVWYSELYEDAGRTRSASFPLTGKLDIFQYCCSRSCNRSRSSTASRKQRL